MPGKSDNDVLSSKLDQALENIQKVDERVEKIDLKMQKICEESLPDIKVDIARLQAKSAIWGGISGVVAAAILSGGIDLALRFFGH